MLGNPPSLASFYDVWRRNPGEFIRAEGSSRPSHLSYSAAATAAAGFALRMRAFGIAKGERVIVWGENSPAWVVVLWGCLLEGVIAVPLDFRSSPAFVARIAGLVDARVLLVGEGLAAPDGIERPVWQMEAALGISTSADKFP